MAERKTSNARLAKSSGGLMRRPGIGFLIACALSSLPVRAQSTTAGPEFQVNTTTMGPQLETAIAMSALGDFVVVWHGDGPGDYDGGVFGQRYDSSGVPIGGEFQVNTYSTDDQSYPDVAMDAAGDFVVVWTSALQDGDGDGIFAQRFDNNGIKQGSEFQVNTYTDSHQYIPKIASDAAGNFVVVWNSYQQDGDRLGVFAQRFGATGGKLGAEFQVNTYTGYEQGDPAISEDPAGNFTVVWQSYFQDGSRYGVFGQRFDNAGGKRGGEFRVSTTTSGYQFHPSIAIDATGGFVVVWSSGGYPGGFGVFGQRFDAAGSKQGTEFPVSSSTTDPNPFSRISSDASGNFVVTWNEANRDGDGIGVVGQQFDGAALKRGPEFQVNSFSTGTQGYPEIRMDRKGNFVVTWQSYGQDGDSWGVSGQRFTCTDIDLDGTCDLQDVVVTAPAELDTVDCLTPLTGRPTIQWDAGDFDRFRVLVGSDPSFAAGTRITSGDTLLRQNSYTVPAKKWKNACRKALAASPLTPRLFIEIFGVNTDVPKSASNRTSFSQVVQVNVAH